MSKVQRKNEYTKGEAITEKWGDWDDAKTDPRWIIKLGKKIRFETIGGEDEANAEELVHRWNAFEENGFVFNLLTMCEAIKLRIHFIGLSSEPMNESGPDWSREIALIESIITKAKKGFEDGKSTKDDS